MCQVTITSKHPIRTYKRTSLYAYFFFAVVAAALMFAHLQQPAPSPSAPQRPLSDHVLVFVLSNLFVMFKPSRSLKMQGVVSGFKFINTFKLRRICNYLYKPSKTLNCGVHGRKVCRAWGGARAPPHPQIFKNL